MNYYGDAFNNPNYRGKVELTNTGGLSFSWVFSIYRKDGYSSSYSRENGNVFGFSVNGQSVTPSYVVSKVTMSGATSESSALVLTRGSFTLPSGTSSLSFSATYYNTDSDSIGSSQHPLSVSGSYSVATAPIIDNVSVAAVGPISNVFVAGRTKARLTITAHAQSGASIVGYYVNGIPTGAVFTSGYVEGYTVFNVSVVDSRGLSASLAVPISVTPYAPPKLYAVTLKRANSSGVAKEDGTYLFAQATVVRTSIVVSGVEKNPLTQFAVQYRVRGTQNWTTAGNLTSGILSSYNVLSSSNSYDSRIIATDAVGSTTVYDGMMTKGVPPIFLGDDNESVSIGTRETATKTFKVANDWYALLPKIGITHYYGDTESGAALFQSLDSGGNVQHAYTIGTNEFGGFFIFDVLHNRPVLSDDGQHTYIPDLVQ